MSPLAAQYQPTVLLNSQSESKDLCFLCGSFGAWNESARNRNKQNVSESQ